MNQSTMITKKVVMLGLWGAGKTSLVSRFVNQIFSEDYHATLGVKMDTKLVKVDDREIKMILWDLAGSEGNFSLPKHFLSGSAAFVIVLDCTREESVVKGAEIIQEMKTIVGDIPFIVALNKVDLDGTVSEATARTLLEKQTNQIVKLLPTSAKTGENVENIFQQLAQTLLAKIKTEKI